MTDKICANCKHWSNPEEDRFPQPCGVGRCRRVRMFWDSTEWRDVGEDYFRVFTAAAEGELAFVQDSSDYHAELLTRSNFGCVQFEEKG